MLLLKRDESTNPPSQSSSSSQPIHNTYMILLLLLSSLLLLFPSLTLAQHEYAFFNSSSLITVPNYIWDLTATTEITFTTCSVSGNLLSLNGSFLSSSPSTPLPSSNNQELAILLHNSSVVFVWSLNGQTGVVYAGNNINNNRWYTVTLSKLLNSLQFSVVQGSSPSNVVVANSSKNSFLLDVRLTGSLKIGEGFYGCLNRGPGVNFSAPGLTDRNIVWDSCPSAAVSGCANVSPDTDDCYRIPCLNGATCVDGVNNYTCVCPRNFNGTNCENDLAALYGCQVQPCMNGGTCSDQIGTTSRRFTCSCPQGFTGTICESTIDLCRTNPCQQGICRSSANSYTCNCTGTGYSGFNCSDDINECLNGTPCGTYPCFNRPGGFYCSCPAGYAGAPCKELDECSSMPCQNGGTCTDGLNVFFCNCAPGYTGQMCGNDINECESNPCASSPNMTCVNLVNNYTCQCSDGFSGHPCRDIDECLLNVCRNNATCSNNPGGYNCSCLPGFTGKNCSTVINMCDPNPCLHNATCSGRMNNYTCSCVPGYTGQNCENDIDECLGRPCYNNATCLNQVNSHKCSCVPGWTGVSCLEDIDECQSNPCLFGSECHNNLNFFNCSCRPGYEGLTCGINIDDCNKTQPCKNGGECFDGVNDYSCNCTSNYMGKNCSDEYDACSFKPCLNGANCTTSKPRHDYTCSCLFGFTGMNCENNIDDCVNARCDSYQRCYDRIGNFTCGCPLGYTGDRCQTEVNECDSEPCKNNGTCANGHGNYTCTCLNRYINLTDLLGPKGLYLTGYNGTNCDNDINECDYNDPPICQAQGKCENSPPGGFTCYCKSAKGEFHTGTLCEQVRSYCKIRLPEEACRNGGTCVDLPLTYRCECVRGFTGQFCETNIDECASSPCQYNGTCEDLVDGYVCTCIEGITGLNCETNINDCEPNPCLHGGVCQDLVNSFSCNCSGTGFNGTTCENNIDDCVENKCEHGGKCVDGIKDYSCDCLPGYTDRMCAVDIPDCNPNPCAYNSLCLENSNASLYNKGDPRFVNFTFEKASGYVCVCVPGLQGQNCNVDIDECVSGPCQHNSTCNNIFKDGFSCACSRGYEGSVCQTEINECIVYKPCKNGGTCFDKLADYDCVCPTPVTARSNYAGKNCTTYLYGCDGSNNKCRNGNCVPRLIGNVHSSFCVCNPGYTGAICSESTDISFRGSQNDYIKSQMNMPEFRLGLRFQTTISNAVLLVWKVSPSSYVSIELTNGRVLLKYKSNFNLQFCSLSTLSMLNNSEYHQLNLTVANNITLALPLDHCGDSSCHTRNCQYIFTLAGNSLPSASQLYIGSGVVSGFQNENFSQSFVGCMEDIVINNDLLYPGKHIGEYFGVSPGCSRVAQCGVNSCNGRGFCEDQWDKYVCHCYRPFYGTYATTCDSEYQAATFGIDQESVVIYSGSIPGPVDDWTFSFFITTRQEDGFIVYFGNPESESMRKLTYVKLYIKNGNLLGDFYKCGYPRHFNTSQISDGFKHFVSVKIKAREFTVNLNSEIVFQDGSVSASSGLCSPGFGFAMSFVKFGQGSGTTVSRARRDVNWMEYANEEMFGVSTRSHHLWKRQANSSSVVNMPGFQGVIQDVQINDEFKLGFNDTSFITPTFLNATIGAFSTKTVCNDTQCENGGNCSNVFYNDFACSCPRGFIGKNCSTVDHCFFGTCPVSSTCQNLQEGYECVSTASFSTDSSIVTYTIAGETPDPILTFDFRTRGLYGLIFLLRKGDYYLKVRVANGRLQMNWKLTSDFSVSMITQQAILFNDGFWYHAKFEVINGTNIKLQVFKDSVLVDETDIVKLVAANFSVEDMLRNGEIVLGSSDKIKFSDLWEASFSGCLRNVRMGGQLMPFFIDEVFKNNLARNKFIAQRVENIVNNCDAKNACIGYSCLNGGVCKDLWNDRKCECPAGLEGSLCEDNPNNCASLPCLNGGVCVDGLGTFTCTCPKGFSGNLCQESLDLCNPNNTALCANGSNCTKQGSDFQCDCAGPDFTGLYCNVSTNQSCSDGLCQNNGSCTNTSFNTSAVTVQSFNCTCRDGYWGPLCEKARDYCNAGVMCANNGSCTNKPEIQSYTCQCNETLDYAGFNCSEKIDNCSGISCPNGVCVDGNRSYICVLSEGSRNSSNVTDYCQIKSPCQHGKCTGDSGDPCNCTGSGWTDQGCNLELNECTSTEPVCNGGNCTNSEGSFHCDCLLGYDGKQCEHPNCSGLCQNNGTCGTNTTHWWCTCPEYVEGPPLCTDVGPCFHKPCDQDNTVNCIQSLPLTNYTCTCKTGWEGVNCTTDVDECSRGLYQCGSGTCFNTNGSYKCNCLPGFTGNNCETDIDECQSNPCEHGGTCLNLVNSFNCTCSDNGYTGVTCSTDVDECTNVTICNDGRCINTVGSYECNCTEKDVGHNCELPNPCYNNTTCLNGGVCQHNITQTGHFQCLCPANYEGSWCEKKLPQGNGKDQDLGVIIGPIVGGVVLIILIIVIIAFVMTARSKRATRGAYSPSQQETSGSRVEMGNVLKKPPEERLI